MADPRKVPFVTLASFSTTPVAAEPKKRRREDEENEPSPGVTAPGVFGAGKPATEPGEPKRTVRLILSLSEPSEQKSAEFNYGELVHSSLQVRSAGNGCGFEPRLEQGNRTCSKYIVRHFRVTFCLNHSSAYVTSVWFSGYSISELKDSRFRPSFCQPVKCKNRDR